MENIKNLVNKLLIYLFYSLGVMIPLLISEALCGTTTGKIVFSLIMGRTIAKIINRTFYYKNLYESKMLESTERFFNKVLKLHEGENDEKS